MSNYINDFSISIMSLENIMERYKLTPSETLIVVETLNVLRKRVDKQ